jgi:hypothetical protein
MHGFEGKKAGGDTMKTPSTAAISRKIGDEKISARGICGKTPKEGETP